MSDLHQYELHYVGFDRTSGGEAILIRLVWAYTIQEAVFQFELEYKARHLLDCRITEAGPVKKAHSHPPGTHFHVCVECQDVVPCAGCQFSERSDSYAPCPKCMGKKPHKHHCQICEAEYDCGWIEKNGSCWLYEGKDVPCTKHTRDEALAFFQKKIDAEKKATL